MQNHGRRFFNYDRAMALLPEVTRLLNQAMAANQDRRKAQNDLQAYRRRLILSGGVIPNSNRMGALEDNAKTSHAVMTGAVHRMQDLGLDVKDVERGLVDFPTLYQGRPVYLCYQCGEDRITHWHGMEEGFAGRKRIDDEFLREHSGDSLV